MGGEVEVVKKSSDCQSLGKVKGSPRTVTHTFREREHGAANRHGPNKILFLFLPTYPPQIHPLLYINRIQQRNSKWKAKNVPT